MALYGDSMSLVNQGTIGAGSDRAIGLSHACAEERDNSYMGTSTAASVDAPASANPCSQDIGAAGIATIANGETGLIEGYIDLAASEGGHHVVNAGSWIIRHHADTDGDGPRDTKRVAVSDLGGGSTVAPASSTSTA